MKYEFDVGEKVYCEFLDDDIRQGTITSRRFVELSSGKFREDYYLKFPGILELTATPRSPNKLARTIEELKQKIKQNKK